MIPPLQPVRLRSILSWVKSSDPHAAGLPLAALDERALAMDEQMLEQFESREDLLKEQMMADGTWGTAAGMALFKTDRMALWQDLCSETLPTSALQLED